MIINNIYYRRHLMRKNNLPKRKNLLFLLTSLCSYPLAIGFAIASDFATLETINVEATNVSAKNTQVSSDQIRRGLVWDERDLIRNQTGITVTEGGRAGGNGYTIRGVDSDRVQMSVDNVSAIESYMPRFYYIKGFYNGNRNSTELENLTSIDFTKGADSLSSGSGALGGSVTMRTKNPQDFVLPERTIGIYSKTGYSSKNDEFRQVLGMGIIHQGIEGLVQFTRRKAKETKNYYSGKIDDVAYCGIIPTLHQLDSREAYPHLCGRGRLLPDDVDFNSSSWLAKLGYRFNHHFIGSFYEDLRQERDIEEKSFYAMGRQQFRDTTPYKRYGVIYEFTPENAWLTMLRLQLTRQDVSQKANSFQYGTSIKSIYNPTPDWNLITDTRQYEFKQKRTQFDTTLKTKEFELFSTSHALDIGTGFHSGELSNRNIETKYSAYSNKTTTKAFTIQQPVKTKLVYGYIKDNIIINDKFGVNAGIRVDQYRYKPQVSNLKYENTRANEIITAAPKKKFSAFNYSLGLNYFINDDSVLTYSFSTGFKAPKVEEMYFDMKGRSGINYVPNLDLRPEKAQNHELTLSIEKEQYALSTSLFYTQYRDFIDLGYQPNIAVHPRTNWGTGEKYNEYVLDGINYQQINIEKAYITGIDFNARMNGNLIGLPQEIYTTFKASYAKGRKNDGTSLLAVQPFSATLGLGYQTNDDKWNILFSSRYVAKKKAKDAMDIAVANSLELDVDRTTGELTGEESAKPHKFLSGSYFVFDLTAQYRVNNHFTINAGVFNLLNRKYSTWDDLRQIKYNGAKGDTWDSGEGLGRYTSPGRHFAVSVEARF